MKKFVISFILAAVGLAAHAQKAGDVLYIYRNDGQFNAFFIDEVDSISYSNYDVDSLYCYDGITTQLVYTSDSLYRIPLAVIDSVAFNDSKIVVSADYLPMDVGDYSIVSADVETGQYVLEFNGSLPDVSPGKVLTIINDTLAQVVRVTSATIQNKQISILSEPADLGDIFLNGSFTLSTESPGNFTRGTKKRDDVFFPVKMSFYDDSNQLRTIKMDDMERSEHGLRLFSYSIDCSGNEIYKNNYVKLYLQTCKCDFNLDIVIKCNFNSFSDAIEKYKKGRLAIHKAVLRGDLKTDFMICFDAQASKKEELEELILKANVHKPIWAMFMVADVPVVVVLNTQLLGHGNYDCSGKFSAYTGIGTSTTVEQGVAWSQSSGLRPFSNLDWKYEVHKPTIEGEASLKAKFGIYPRFNFSLYGILGPSFEIRPYARMEAEMGWFDELGTNAGDYYGATINTFSGYDAAVGLTMLALAGKDPFVKSPVWNVVDKHLYEGPYSIKLASNPDEELTAGIPYRVTFTENDYDHLLGRRTTAQFPFMVKFETNSGSLNHDFTFVDINSSTASVEWTPSRETTDGQQPYIVALMYDASGHAIAGDRWKPNVNIPPLPPVAITGDCSHVTATTAIISCSYEHVPENAVCCVEYLNSIDTLNVDVATYDGMQVVTLANLQPGTTYTYRAYIKTDQQRYYGEDKTFTTETVIPDIVGEWNCTEYNEDGSQRGEPYKITLYENHTAKSELWTRNDSGKWNVYPDGKVTINFEWDNPYRYAYLWHTYGGTVNKFILPYRNEATKSETTQVAEDKSHFIMTR